MSGLRVSDPDSKIRRLCRRQNGLPIAEGAVGYIYVRGNVTTMMRIWEDVRQMAENVS